MPNVTDLPTPFVMAVGGKTYRVKPLTLGDLLELAKYHRDNAMIEAKRQMVGLPLDLAKHAWDEAKKNADKIVVGSLEKKLADITFEGLIYGLWLGLKPEQPQMSLDDVRSIFDADISLASDTAMEAMGYTRPNPLPPTTTGETATAIAQ